MRFVQYYLECLSQASYLIADQSAGVAAVVDPRRDVQDYLDDAAAVDSRIIYVIETHLHADFLSGHLELAEATGATIVYGAAAEVHFARRAVADGERIGVGRVVLEFRATPGHTPESISVVVWDGVDAEVPYGVLTGDTLFIGDVGRPDLATSAGWAAADLARMLPTRCRPSCSPCLTPPWSTPRTVPGYPAASSYRPTPCRPSAPSAPTTTRSPR
jgi:hydroxyacylglutathione hydrolase